MMSRLTGTVRCKACGHNILLLAMPQATMAPGADLAEIEARVRAYRASIDSDPAKLHRTGLICKPCRLVVCIECALAVKAPSKLACPECKRDLEFASRATLSSVKSGKLFA